MDRFALALFFLVGNELGVGILRIAYRHVLVQLIDAFDPFHPPQRRDHGRGRSLVRLRYCKWPREAAPFAPGPDCC